MKKLLSEIKPFLSKGNIVEKAKLWLPERPVLIESQHIFYQKKMSLTVTTSPL